MRLYELRREQKMRKARDWFANSYFVCSSDELNAICPPGSEPNTYLRMIVSYWEMAASFVTAGILNQDLFFENNQEFLFVWERIRELVPAMRKDSANPAALRNFETVANAFIQWMEERAPGSHGAFRARVNPREVARGAGR